MHVKVLPFSIVGEIVIKLYAVTCVWRIATVTDSGAHCAAKSNESHFVSASGGSEAIRSVGYEFKQRSVSGPAESTPANRDKEFSGNHAAFGI